MSDTAGTTRSTGAHAGLTQARPRRITSCTYLGNNPRQWWLRRRPPALGRSLDRCCAQGQREHEGVVQPALGRLQFAGWTRHQTPSEASVVPDTAAHSTLTIWVPTPLFPRPHFGEPLIWGARILPPHPLWWVAISS